MKIIFMLTTMAIAVLAGLASAQQQLRTTITGYPPFELGVDMASALALNSSLQPESDRVWTSRVPAVRYSARVPAPIGGFNYRATLWLEFWNGRLGVVGLYWSPREFGSVGDWGNRTADLYKQLVTTYAHELVKTNLQSDRSRFVLIMRDSNGNELHGWSGYHFDITLAYLWAHYTDSIQAAPAPRTNS